MALETLTPQRLELRRCASGPAAVAPVPVAACAVCMDEREAATLVSLCGAGGCDALLCAACAREYLRGRAGGSRGFCPRVVCPGPACGAFLPIARWAPHADPETVGTYAAAAQAMLTLQCASCDGRGSLLPAHHRGAGAGPAAAIAGVPGALERHLGGERGAADEVVRLVIDEANRKPDEDGSADLRRRAAALRERARAVRDEAAGLLRREEGGEAGEARRRVKAAAVEKRRLERLVRSGDGPRASLRAAAADYDAAVAHVRAVMASPAGDGQRRSRELLRESRKLASAAAAAEAELRGIARKPADRVTVLMRGLLESIPDDERRATLMLALVRRRPVVQSRCHGRDHCFNCKTYNLHQGLTCEQHQARNLPQDVRFCPGCRMPLLKGDGCSSIKCVCGHRFSWNAAPRAE